MKHLIFSICFGVALMSPIGLMADQVIVYADTLAPANNSGSARPTDTQTSNQTRLFNPLKVTSVTGVVDLIIGIVLRIAFIVAVLAIMYSGFLFVKAQGNEQEITKAKEVFWNTVIGVALIFGASGLVKIIQVTLDAIRV